MFYHRLKDPEKGISSELCLFYNLGLYAAKRSLELNEVRGLEMRALAVYQNRSLIYDTALYSKSSNVCPRRQFDCNVLNVNLVSQNRFRGVVIWSNREVLLQ